MDAVEYLMGVTGLSREEVVETLESLKQKGLVDTNNKATDLGLKTCSNILKNKAIEEITLMMNDPNTNN